MHVHTRKVFIGEFVGDNDRDETCIAATPGGDLASQSLDAFVREVDQGSDLRERSGRITCLFRHDGNAACAAMRGKRLAEPVQDAAPLWRREGQLDMVVLGSSLVFLALKHLKLEETCDETGPDDSACPCRDDHAAGEIVLNTAVTAHAACPTDSPGARPRSNRR